jgi:hypothetical protein
MESEGSLPCSQEPCTDPYPEPDQSNPYDTILFPFEAVYQKNPSKSEVFCDTL